MCPFQIFNTTPASKDSFHLDGFIGDMNPLLVKSWARSKQNNLSPYLEQAPVKQGFELNDLDNILLDAAIPYYKHFNEMLQFNECTLALCNKDGVIIHLSYRSGCTKIKIHEKHNFLIRADWSETGVGTNAISMAITERKNVYVIGSGHYSFAFSPYSCVASPIYNPNNKGEIIGVVDVSGFIHELNHHSLGWVSALARLIEKEISLKVQNPIQAGLNRITKGATLLCNRTKNQIAGENPIFRTVLKDAEKTAKTDLNILLTGETGTGKEVIARYIHHFSSRAQGPFVAVNCAAIPKELVNSELFGYQDGAFTGASRRGHIGRFEQAQGGTLFLDEIADAPHEVQVSLLRVLEEKTVYKLGSTVGIPIDVRVLAATSQDLSSLIDEGLFREDLYYRLAGVILEIPSLRERGQDIILLAEHFLNRSETSSLRRFIMEPQLKQEMLQYSWPGNIRELKNVVERMEALADSEILTRDLFLKCIQRRGTSPEKSQDPFRKELIAAFAQARGNITRVAEMLSVDRSTIYRRMKKYGLKSKYAQ